MKCSPSRSMYVSNDFLIRRVKCAILLRLYLPSTRRCNYHKDHNEYEQADTRQTQKRIEQNYQEIGEQRDRPPLLPRKWFAFSEPAFMTKMIPMSKYFLATRAEKPFHGLPLYQYRARFRTLKHKSDLRAHLLMSSAFRSVKKSYQVPTSQFVGCFHAE